MNIAIFDDGIASEGRVDAGNFRGRHDHRLQDEIVSVIARDSAVDCHPAVRCERDRRGWRVAVETRNRPVALISTRQNVPMLDRAQFAAADGLRRGVYVLADAPDGKPDIILIATGSEVSLIVAAGQKLTEDGISDRIVSMPSWELFETQSQEYRDSVLPPTARARLAVEAGVARGWCKYVGDDGDVIGVDQFGASAPGEVGMRA